MKVEGRSVFCIVLTFVIFVVFIGCVILLFSRYLVGGDNFVSYNHIILDPETSTHNLGIVKLSNKLNNEEYLSYVRGGKHHLISSFGSTEYKCYGTCICEDEEVERRSISLVRNGLFTLLAATSAIAAMNICKKEFLEECIQQFSDSCDSDKIDADVEINTFDDLVEKRIQEGYYDKIGEVFFWCSGNCLPTDSTAGYIKDGVPEYYEYPIHPKDFKFYDCTKLTREGFVKIDPASIESEKYDIMRYNMGGGSYEEKLEFLAKKWFDWQYLGLYCWEKSRYEVSVDYSNPLSGEVTNLPTASSWCFFGGTKFNTNPSTKCERRN